MKRQSASSGSGIFLAELLIAILIFASVSAVCSSIFVSAKGIAEDSHILNSAVSAAQSGAECFKAARGDLGDTAALLNAAPQAGDGYIDVFLDAGCNAIGQTGQGKAEYIMRIEYISKHSGYIDGKVSVRNNKGMPIYSLKVSALEDVV